MPSEDRHARTVEARLLLDCATICRACADFLCRKSDHQAVICLACAEIATPAPRPSPSPRTEPCASARRPGAACAVLRKPQPDGDRTDLSVDARSGPAEPHRCQRVAASCSQRQAANWIRVGSSSKSRCQAGMASPGAVGGERRRPVASAPRMLRISARRAGANRRCGYEKRLIVDIAAQPASGVPQLLLKPVAVVDGLGDCGVKHRPTALQPLRKASRPRPKARRSTTSPPTRASVCWT